MSKPINVYSTPDLRQTLDEALPTVLSRLEYEQTFKLIDTKLLIGYSIAVVAGISFLLDKKLTFQDALMYQKILVGLYAILSVLFWYFTKYVERGVKYTGSCKDRSISIATNMEKYDFQYNVTITDNKGVSVEARLGANTVFNEQGYLQPDILFKWFEEKLGMLDKKTQ